MSRFFFPFADRDTTFSSQVMRRKSAVTKGMGWGVFCVLGLTNLQVAQAQTGKPTGDLAGEKADALPDLSVAVGNVFLSVLTDRLHAGELTVDEAFASGDLSIEDAVSLLASASDWGAIGGKDNVPLRQGLARLIVEKDAGRLGKKLLQTPLKARLWIAEYLQVQGDERAVAVFESVLGELKDRAPLREYGDNALAFLGIERIVTSWRHGIMHKLETKRTRRSFLQKSHNMTFRGRHTLRCGEQLVSSSSRTGTKKRANFLVQRFKVPMLR